ncbi:MAG: glycoside hydrolase domain-containing protein [Xenococcaceae cyanobacterium]
MSIKFPRLRLYFRIFIIASISFLTVIYTSQLANTKYYQDPIIWAVSGLERITPKVSAGNKTQIQLMAARGEYESFQIGIKAPSKGLRNVNVFISDLKKNDGTVISQNNITLYREHYIFVPAASPEESRENPSLGVGLYADGLIPFIDPDTGQNLRGAELDAVPFDLKARDNQPVWVDIFVPRDASPGEYTGTYKVTSDRGQRQGKISLKVWNFELPQQPSLNSTFLLWKQKNEQAAIAELLKHKIMPGVNINPSSEQELQELIDKWELNFHQIRTKQPVATIPQSELNNDRDSAPSEKHTWIIKAPARITKVLTKEDEVGFSTDLEETNYPKWLIDYQPINFRIPHGFISQSLGITGIFYWRADLWTDDPWNQITVYIQDRQTFPGEAMLIYPGDKVGIQGVVPSMRLKWIREGVEDYEYVEILKQLGEEEWAMEIVRSVGADWQNWTKGPAKLELARRKLGNKIESLQQS